jgi:CBS domain-containing membrane protein
MRIMRAQDPVNHLMTEPVLSVDVTAPVSEALRLFAEYPVHHLPVVRERTLVGMLSSADIMKLEGFLPKGGKVSRDYLDQRFRIEMLMRRPAISVQAHQPAEDAARLMVTHAVHALPVVNAQDQLLGIITTTDLMQAVLNASPRHGEHADASLDPTALERKPDPAAFENALRAARAATLAAQDADGVAQTLLYLHQRVAALEDVLKLMRRYLTAGQDEALHTKLMKAIERAEDLDQRAKGEPGTTLGLGQD